MYCSVLTAPHQLGHAYACTHTLGRSTLHVIEVVGLLGLSHAHRQLARERGDALKLGPYDDGIKSPVKVRRMAIHIHQLVDCCGNGCLGTLSPRPPASLTTKLRPGALFVESKESLYLFCRYHNGRPMDCQHPARSFPPPPLSVWRATFGQRMSYPTPLHPFFSPASLPGPSLPWVIVVYKADNAL